MYKYLYTAVSSMLPNICEGAMRASRGDSALFPKPSISHPRPFADRHSSGSRDSPVWAVREEEAQEVEAVACILVAHSCRFFATAAVGRDITAASVG